jgi:hypothetical protein
MAMLLRKFCVPEPLKFEATDVPAMEIPGQRMSEKQDFSLAETTGT